MGAIQQVLAAETAAGSTAPTVTWDPSNKGGSVVTLSNQNLTATRNDAGFTDLIGFANTAIPSGKYYFEVQCVHYPIGIGISPLSETGYPGAGSGYGFYAFGRVYHSGSTVAIVSGLASTTGDICQVAVDVGAGKLWFGKNNVFRDLSNNVASPSAGTNPTFTGLSGTFYPSFDVYYNPSSAVTARFRSADMTYSPPSGFSTLE